MASRKLEDLAPQFRDRFLAWLGACKAQGLDLLVTCTYRSKEEQDALYAQGRTKPGKKITNAQAGESPHNFSLALDFVPIVDGKPMWNDEHPAWRTAGNLCPAYGLEWGGSWSRFRDMPHVQVPNWRGLIQ